MALERLLVDVDGDRHGRFVRVDSVLIATDVEIRIHPASEGQNRFEKLLTPALEVLSPLAVLALSEAMVVLLRSPRSGFPVGKIVIRHGCDLSSPFG